MNVEKQTNVNLLLAVGIGTIIWMVLLKTALPVFNLAHALILAAWIALGSRHYVKAFVDFQRPLRPTILLGLGLMSPAWPILHWKRMHGGSTGSEPKE